MTKGPNYVDFTTVSWRPKEAPDGLPVLARYKPEQDDVVVIDAGSYQYRAGYASKELPALVFDPLVHRYQGKTGEAPQFAIGRAVPAGVTRTSSRTPYEEGNVIMHSQSLEHILDDVLSKLRVPCEDGALGAPVFMTEVVVNPPCCRRETSELLFEAYGAPKVAYGADGPLSWHWNRTQRTNGGNGDSALIIAVGNYHTVITAVVGGKVGPEHVKRISFGGHVMSEFMLQMLQCKYPTFPVKMTLAQAQEVVHRVCRVALDYDVVLAGIAGSDATLREEDVTVQFPYSTETLAERLQKEEARKAIAEKRREQAHKLRERAEKARNEKLEAKRQQLESMRRLAKQAAEAAKADAAFDDVEEDRVLQQLRLFGYESVEELHDAIETEQKDLNRRLGIEEPKEAPDYSLVDVPDAELSAEQIKEKRKQRLLKASADARERLKKEKEAEEQRLAEMRERLEQRRIHDFDGWREDLYNERGALAKGLKARQKKKDALADRRSQASGARLRNVVSLIEDDEEDEAPSSKPTKKRRTKKDAAAAQQQQQQPPQEDAGFGDDDADWLIYRQISRDDEAEGEEEEAMQKRLAEIEEELERHDCEAFYELVACEMNMAVTILDKLRNGISGAEADPNATKMQLHVNVERYRVTEGLLQPGAILGLEQAGLMEAIEDLLKHFSQGVRAVLAENVYLTGGASQMGGLEQRMERELAMILSVGARTSVIPSADPLLDAWKGAALLCRESNSTIPWITREWYDENGGERLPGTCWFTNQF